MIDTVRGTLRVRKWPKKRGTPTSPKQLFWIDWFRQANLLAKYADGMSQARAIQMSEGWPLYPRDILLKAMRGWLYDFTDTTGWRWFSMAAIGSVSESLDALAQTVGSVLVRSTDRWRAVVPGAIGDRLTYQGDTAPPTWEAVVPSAPPLEGALVTRAAFQAIPNNANTIVIWDVEQYDDDDIHDQVTNPARLTVPTDWTRVRLTAGTQWQNVAGGARSVTIWKNGAFFPGQPASIKGAVGVAGDAITTPAVDVVAGDYFEMIVWHNQGAAVALAGGASTTFFAMERIA